MAHKQTYWRDNRQLTEEEAFDERGVLRDGVCARVKTMMRDGKEIAENIMMYDNPVPLGYQLVTDGEGRTLVDAMGTPLDPTYSRRGYVFTDNTNRERPIDESHPDVQKAYISNNWKNGVEPGDVVTINGRQMIGTHYTDEGSVEFADINTMDGDALKKCAYDEAKRNLSERWKTKPMKKQKEPDEREWEVSGPLSDSSQGSEVKREAWEQSCRDLQDAWKR